MIPGPDTYTFMERVAYPNDTIYRPRSPSHNVKKKCTVTGACDHLGAEIDVGLHVRVLATYLSALHSRNAAI